MNYTDLLIGAIVGFFIGFFIFRQKLNELGREEARLQESNKRVPELESDLSKSQEEGKKLTADLSALNAEISVFKTTLEKEREHFDEKQKDFLNIEKKFQETFENLANKILENKSKKFSKENQESLKTLLTPLKEKITTFEKQVQDTHKDTIKENAALKQLVEDLTKLNHKISEDAEKLTAALKGDSKTQGNWGEMILESILEKSGLQEGREYTTQTALTSEEGQRMLPDVIVNLPENKNVIIDSKVSLTAYERFASAEKDSEKEKALKEHILSLKNHVKSLSSKNYQKLNMPTPDFVLLFIPIEGAFSAALQNQQDLMLEASDKNIMLVSPTTLMSTLKIIRYIWQQDHQNQNATEIARQSGNLYDKFVAFVEDLTNIGKKIDQSQIAYDQAVNKLHTGKGNLIKRAENLKELGAKTSKILPSSLNSDEIINVDIEDSENS